MSTLEPASTPSEPLKSALHLMRKKVKEGLEPGRRWFWIWSMPTLSLCWGLSDNGEEHTF